MSMYPKRVRQALKNRWTNQTGLKQAGSANKIGNKKYWKEPDKKKSKYKRENLWWLFRL